MDPRNEQPPSGPPRGTAETHSHLSAGSEAGRSEDIQNRMRETADEAGNRFEAFRRNTADQMGEIASQTRQRAGRMLDDAERNLDERTNLVSKTQEYPLAALGIAFGAGFLLAGSGESAGGSPRISKATNQLKGALMGGLSAAVSREIRTFIDEQGGASGLTDKLRSAMSSPSPDGGRPTEV